MQLRINDAIGFSPFGEGQGKVIDVIHPTPDKG
jgi:hypothetical protein